MDILTDDLTAAGVRISPSGRVSYPEKYTAYAERFGKKTRAIRDWVAHGKNTGSLPPLHDPGKMIIWWKAFKKSKPPQVFLDLGFESPVEQPTISVTENFPEDEEEGRVQQAGDIEVTGAEEALDQARALTSEAYKRLRECIKDNDLAGAEGWRKDWTAAVETQRKWEKDFNKIQEDRGLLVRKAVIQEEVLEMATTLQRAFLQSLVDLVGKVSDLPEPERRALAVAERDRCFEVLRLGDFDGLFCLEA